jgi:hypothetical protein
LLASAAFCGSCAPAPDNGNALRGEAAATPYMARFHDDSFPTPDTSEIGAFFIRSGCLVFVSADGTSYLAVLPKDAELTPSAEGGWQLIVGGKPVAEGRNYRVKGGEGQYGIPVRPPACPNKQFLVGEIR